jgi:hypothetical protein
MGANTDGQPKSAEEADTDRFELMTAILLGVAALGAALASLQGGQWGGKQLEAFSQSNTMTTLAARDYNEAVSSQNADYAIIAQAKQLLINAAEAETEADEQRNLRSVSYLYTQQLTWQAMKALGLPEAMWSSERTDEEGTEAAEPAAAAAPAEPSAEPSAPTPAPTADAEDAEGEDAEEEAAPAPAGEAAAAPAAAEEEEQSAGEAAIDAAMANMLPEEMLWATINVELHDEDSSYGDDLYTEPVAQFDAADARFKEGQTANNNGDQFDLAGVFYTVALFFAGLGLVFKTKARWPFFGLGTIVFLATSIFMAMQPWAG